MTKLRQLTAATSATLALLASMSMADMASAQQLSTIGPNGDGSGDTLLGGSSTLTFSAGALSALDTYAATVTGAGAATANVQQYSDGTFSQIGVMAPNTSFTVDLQQAAIYGVNSTGGISITVPSLQSFSTGGTLTVTDLSVDFGTKLISGTLIGSNGLGTVQNVPLWRADNLSSNIVGCPNWGMCDAPLGDNHEYKLESTLNGLHLTVEGGQAFVSALGLQKLGQGPLNSIIDFGAFSTVTMYAAASSLHVVPEPATWALMGLGLIGLFGVSRCKAH